MKKENLKLKTERNGAAIAIALILLLSLSGTMLMASPASAQTTTMTFPSNAFASIAPDPVGVNQQTTIIMWLTEFAPTASGVGGGRWTNFTLSITAPDGTTQNLGPFTADDASTAWTTFTPTQVGKYTIKFSFPGQLEKGISGFFGLYPVDAYYEASSFTTTLTVQQAPVTGWQQTPLPTGYWSRPINAQNQEWYTIAGNWLKVSSSYSIAGTQTGENLYSTAPSSAHIVWTKPLTFGGLMGGESGGTTTSNYYTGKLYETMFSPIVINGVLYYNDPMPPRFGYSAVDLRTGETLWWQNSSGSVYMTMPTQGIWTYPGLSAGQVYSFRSPNEEGGRAYLWWTGNDPWRMYDAATGEQILTIANVTAGSMVEGPNGELLVYVLNGATGWLAVWNSTKCIGTLADQFNPALFNTYTGYWCWRPQTGATLDWNRGVQMNVTIPKDVPTQSLFGIDLDAGVILATEASMLNSQPLNSQMEIGYDSTTGQRLWIQNRTFSPQTIPYSLMMSPIGDGMYAEFNPNTMQWTAYSLKTGNKIWGPTEAYTKAWGSQQQTSIIAYGNLYGSSVDGIHAFSGTTGDKLWDFYPDNSGTNVPAFDTYPNLAFTTGPYAADGKLYFATGTSHGDAMYLGSKMYCVDAISGAKIWEVSFFGVGYTAIADGYVVAQNGYDNQLYCFGKGQTGTTVTATSGVGNTVTIQGTVTDQSPGTTSLGTPAAGTPAIADEFMSRWMEYLYQQMPKPTDAIGVPIKLQVVDANGNLVSTIDAKSDMDGHYTASWIPSASGTYTVKATFAGSNSYYSSSGVTGISVGTLQAASTSESTGISMTTFALALAAVVILAIVAVAVALLSRRRQTN